MFQFEFVGITEKEDTFALQPVSSCTPGLLIIPFNTLRQVIVNNIPDIRLVNAHSECDSSDDDFCIVTYKPFLILRPYFRSQACMIWKGPESFSLKPSGNVLHSLAALTIDNSRISLSIFQIV